ncbi:hypothetical protein MN116_008769 [Schistosoma mekongi]|uniref:PIR Superfamily Protein n=1 Tax=Schistosoma mekongi TaxID=38744 RepID=A0AAE1Z633_SCHME|nr:hypothetical protein MN116_008769 [Schistosoma mekongi]
MKMMLMFLFYINLFLILINESIQNDEMNTKLSIENKTIDKYVDCTTKRLKGTHGSSVIRALNNIKEWELPEKDEYRVITVRNWNSCLDELEEQYIAMKEDYTEDLCNSFAPSSTEVGYNVLPITDNEVHNKTKLHTT